MPALPLDDAGPYVAAAYLVFLALILIYVAIMASKLVRISRDLGELDELLDRRDRRAEAPADDAAHADEAATEERVPR
jgi:uncharacterized membrane protein YccC